MPHQRKYRINELLDNLPLKKNRLALHVLPDILDVRPKTLHNYRSIKLDDQQDIPHEKVVILELFFGLKPGELQNFTKEIKPIYEMDENEVLFDPAAFGLVKA